MDIDAGNNTASARAAHYVTSEEERADIRRDAAEAALQSILAAYRDLREMGGGCPTWRQLELVAEAAVRGKPRA